MDVPQPLTKYGRLYYNPKRKMLSNCSGEELKLRPQSLKVFLYLAENHGEIISKDRLISAVWKNVFVTDDSLVQCITDIRKTLKDTKHTILQTFPRKGYLLSLPKSVPKPISTELLPFIGREEELTELENMLQNPECRLLVMLGLGGVGKSRVSQALQKRLEESNKYVDGANFVSLATLQSSELIPSAIANCLKVSLQGTRAPVEILADTLQTKESLLILDNIEHLLPDVEICLTLLEACPDLNILITSRFPVQLQGEWIYQLEGLHLPDTVEDFDNSAACQLFIQTTQRLKHSFYPCSQEKQLILEICRLVGGLPLGIEIAARWAQHLTSTEIIEEIQEQLLNNGLDTSNTNKTSDLAKVLRQSWQMLTEREQSIMQALAFFRGDFTREAATAVADVSVSDISELINKSMLARNMQGRYVLHEVMRRYANKRRALGNNQQHANEKFFDYHLQLADTADTNILGGDQFHHIKQLELEHANLRECLSFCSHGQVNKQFSPESGVAMVGSLGMFWFLSNHWKEGRDWAMHFLNTDRYSQPSANCAAAMLTAGGLSVLLDDYVVAEKYLTIATEMAKQFSSDSQQARGLTILGVLRRLQGDYPEAIKQSKQSLKLFESASDKGGYQFNLGNMGHSLLMNEKYDEAAKVLEQCVQLNQQIGTTMSLPYALVNLGRLHLKLNQPNAARIYLHRAIDVSDKIGIFLYQAQSLCLLGWAEVYADNIIQAQSFFQKGAESYLHLGDRHGLADSMSGIAVVKSQQNELATAMQFISVADVLVEDSQIPVSKDNLTLLKGTEKRIQQGLKPEEREIYRKLGLSSSPKELFNAL